MKRETLTRLRDERTGEYHTNANKQKQTSLNRIREKVQKRFI